LQKRGGLPGIEPGTASTLRKNHTPRLKPPILNPHKNTKINNHLPTHKIYNKIINYIHILMDSVNQKSTHVKRNVGLQTIIQSKEYLPPSIAIQHNLEAVDYPKFFAIPHTLLTLVITCALVGYFALKTPASKEEAMTNGMLGLIFGFLAFGSIYMPDSILRRPHPVIWRLLFSSMILYSLVVTYLVFQSTDEARQLLKIFDKRLGVPLKERIYSDQCDLSSPTFPYIDLTNFINNLDFYLSAHLVGWYVKMLIVRDWKICAFLSVFFEFLEITFRNWLPNFQECWWDVVILDILGCNALGIYLGHLTIKYFEMKNYKWITKNTETKVKKENNPKIKSAFKKLYKYAKYFTPNFYIKHEWNIFSSTKRFWAFIWYIIFMGLVDLMHFFLKDILWIPPNNYILFVRINIWAYTAIVCTREYIEYISNKSCRRLYQNIWLCHYIVFMEVCMCYKFSNYTAPFPQPILYIWSCIFVIIAGITVHLAVQDITKYLKNGPEKTIDLVDPTVEIEYLDK
jgi:phosphatidylserine synthase 2